MKKSVKIAIVSAMLLASAALAVIGILLLPDTLTMQITVSGEGGTKLPKLAGLAIPFILSTVFPVLFYINGGKKNLFISAVGFAFYAFTFIVNL